MSIDFFRLMVCCVFTVHSIVRATAQSLEQKKIIRKRVGLAKNLGLHDRGTL